MFNEEKTEINFDIDKQFDKKLKARCHTRFQRAFTACCFVFEETNLDSSNQRNYFNNANLCSKRTMKTRVATRL